MKKAPKERVIKKKVVVNVEKNLRTRRNLNLDVKDLKLEEEDK